MTERGKRFVYYRKLVTPSVLHLSTTGAAGGGAGRAAEALHRAMVQEGIASHMITARGPKFNFASWADRQVWKLQRSPVKTWRSPAVFGSLSAKQINAHPADVVNLHWITNGFLTIEEIGRIEKPIVWSLYDMWAFCGTEHYGVDSPDARWRTGYTKANRPESERGVDIDRHAWQRKQRHWQASSVVAASTWLTDRARDSALMGAWPITTIPHVIDTGAFAVEDREVARNRLRLNLPSAVPVILFLSSAGISDTRKGFDLLEESLPPVKDQFPETRLLVVGPPDESRSHAGGLPIVWFGTATSNNELRDLYCAADIVAVPSREDNMPLTAMEGQACGRPVVAFNVGGLPDIIKHLETGYLAHASDSASFAEGLIHALSSRRKPYWGSGARERAVQQWSPHVVVKDYVSVYESLISSSS